MASHQSLTNITTRSQHRVTDFQERVYGLLLQIPQGSVTTYGSLAAALSTSPRAVGNALRNNPFAPEVPCHRCIASTGFINGFNGEKFTLGSFKRDEDGTISGNVRKSLPKGAKLEWERQTKIGGGGVESGGTDGVATKLDLLRQEGVEFDERGLLKDRNCLFEGPWVTDSR